MSLGRLISVQITKIGYIKMIISQPGGSFLDISQLIRINFPTNKKAELDGRVIQGAHGS